MAIPPNRVILNERNRQQAQNYTFPEDIGPHGMLMVFRKYSYKATRSLLNNNTPEVVENSSILLPIPNNIQDRYQVRVQRFDQGTYGDIISSAAAGAAANGDNMIGAASSALSQFLPSGSNLANSLTSGDSEQYKGFAQDLGNSANFLLRKTLDGLGPNITRNFDAGFGSTINPKAALSFEGVEMKNHSFEWTFAPKTPTESDRLRSISNLVKRNILPTYQDFSAGGEAIVQRAMLRYPSTVDLYFLGVDPNYYMFFKTCMVQSFDMNLTPQGLSILSGGKPAVVNMAMTLIENDIHTAEDYDGSVGPSLSDQTPSSTTTTE